MSHLKTYFSISNLLFILILSLYIRFKSFTNV